MPKQILCADIGGTNARFAHFELESEQLNLCKIHTCKTIELADTIDLIEEASKCGLDTQKAHIQIWGIAGPIEENGLHASLTNNPLRLDFSPFITENSAPFLMVNDFTLQAWASLVDNLELLPIINGYINPRATRAILGAGTGLGTAALLPIKAKSWSILQAEGGHSDMAFYGKEELDFASFALEYLKQERLSAEDILSAKGLSLLHKYVHDEQLSPQEAIHKLSVQKDSLALSLYARFLGRFCKNWALNTLCVGGLFLGGGVLAKNPFLAQHNDFIQEFKKAPTSLRKTIEQVPIMLMQNEHAGLWGAAHAAKTMLTGK